MRHGHGKMTYKDGRVYSGDWVRDSRQGFGTLTFPGRKLGGVRQYAGDWSEDRREGFGIMLYSDKVGRGSYLSCSTVTR